MLSAYAEESPSTIKKPLARDPEKDGNHSETTLPVDNGMMRAKNLVTETSCSKMQAFLAPLKVVTR